MFEMRILVPATVWESFKSAVGMVWFDGRDAALTLHKNGGCTGVCESCEKSEMLCFASFTSDVLNDIMLVWRMIPNKGFFRFVWTDMVYEEVNRPRE